MRFVFPLAAAGLVLLGGLPRILLAGGILPSALRPFTWSDPLYTYVRDGGRLPYWEGLYEYPPLTGYVAGILSILSSNAVMYVTLWTLVLAACAGIVAALLTDVAPGRLARWSFAPQLAFLGTLNFDLLAVVFVVLGTVRAMSRLGILGLAAGGMAKLFPFACLPVAIARDPRPVRAFAIASIAVAVITVPSLLTPHPPQEGTAFYASLGSNFDSLWGTISRMLDLVALPGETVILAITTAGLIGSLALFLVPRLREGDRITAYAIAILCVLIWTRRFSPQYSLWILPFFALLPIPRRLYLLYVAADVTVFLTVTPLTLTSGAPIRDFAGATLLGVLVAAVAVRHIALIFTLRRLLGPARPDGAYPERARLCRP